MSLTALLGSLLLAVVSGGPATPSSEDLTAYESARTKVGRDAEAHIRLALWCERRSLEAERARHLALAVLIEPGNVTARGLLGLVKHEGKWEDPAQVGERIRADPALAAKLAEYNARRDALDQELRSSSRLEAEQAHVKLGLWCEQKGLKAEATAHFTSAVVLNPEREASWKHLGYIKHNGRWMSREQVDAEEREAALQKEADRRWEPQLRKWRSMLADADAGARTETEDQLAKVDDPRAVPAIVRVFASATEPDQLRGVQMLGRIDSPGSTWELARLAVKSASPTTRKAAVEALKPRNRRDYAGRLVEMIRAPIRYQVEPIRGPGSTGFLATETPPYRVLRTYDAPPLFPSSFWFRGHVTYDAVSAVPLVVFPNEAKALAGWRGTVRQARALTAIYARTANYAAFWELNTFSTVERMATDVQQVVKANRNALALNERVSPVLQDSAGAPDLGYDEDAWRTWWADEVGSTYQRPPEIIRLVNRTPPQMPPQPLFHNSCFAPGTPVCTRDGRRPIETLRVGDQVLSQDVTTGLLSFQPILVVHRNPPREILHVELDNGETLRASAYHRFWRAGLGWAMARELKEGDLLRTLGGLARVVSVSAGPTEPLCNLDVDGGRTFFVGQHDTLVHDNSLPAPRLEPFDTAPELVVASHSDG
jgi:hypothetical protein